jgi:hypothetical protein
MAPLISFTAGYPRRCVRLSATVAEYLYKQIPRTSAFMNRFANHRTEYDISIASKIFINKLWNCLFRWKVEIYLKTSWKLIFTLALTCHLVQLAASWLQVLDLILRSHSSKYQPLLCVWELIYSPRSTSEIWSINMNRWAILCVPLPCCAIVSLYLHCDCPRLFEDHNG